MSVGSVEVAGAAGADAAAVDDGHARVVLDRGLVRVADDEHQRPRRRIVLEDRERGLDQRRLVDHDHVDLADQRQQPRGERVLHRRRSAAARSGP